MLVTCNLILVKDNEAGFVSQPLYYKIKARKPLRQGASFSIGTLSV